MMRHELSSMVPGVCNTLAEAPVSSLQCVNLENYITIVKEIISMSKYKVSSYSMIDCKKKLTTNIQLVSGNNRVMCSKVYSSNNPTSYEIEIAVLRGMLRDARYIKSMKLHRRCMYGRYVYIVKLNNSTKVAIMRTVMSGKYRYMVNRFISREYSTLSGCINGIFTLSDNCDTDNIEVKPICTCVDGVV